MALKAGYVGIKSQLMQTLRDKLLKLDGIIPAGASSENPLATESEINGLWEANAKTGVHNIMPPVKVEGGNDVTVSISDKNVISFTGTPNESNYYKEVSISGFTLKKGSYKFGRAVSNNQTDVTGTVIAIYSGATSIAMVRLPADENKDIVFTLNADTAITKFAVYIPHTSAAIDITYYPIIMYGDDTDTTYAPYAMTNQELTTRLNTITDGVFSIGRLVVVNKEITLTAALVQGWNENHADFTGLPNPVSYVPFRGHISGGSFEDFLMNTQDSNNILSTAAHDVGTKIRLSFVYLTNETTTAALTRTIEDPAATKKTTRSKKTKEE